MQILDFLNSRNLGKTKNTSIESAYWRPNLDSIISRLACVENDVYLSIGEGGYVPPFACKFRKDKQRDLLAVANEDGEIMLIDTDGEKGLIKSFSAHHNAIYDICWLPDKNNLVTVSGDHRACLWDLNTCQLICSFKNHTESIKSVDVCYNDTALIATASKDGTICLWDTRDKCPECGTCRDKPSIAIKNAHYTKTNLYRSRKFPSCNTHINGVSVSGVSAVAFQDNINLASSGNSDGVIKMWDLRKTYISKPTYIPSPRYQMKYDKSSGHGCTSLVFDSLHKKLYGCSTAHKIYMFDCHTYSDAAVSYDGFKCKTYYVKMALSADDQYLLCGSSDNKGYIWKTSKPGLPIYELPGHNAEVTAVAWGSDDITKLVTCGDDNKVLVWKTINDQNVQVQRDIVAQSLPFQNCDKTSCSEESDMNHSASVIINYSSKNRNQPSTSAHSTIKTPTMKSITSFFQPVSSNNTNRDSTFSNVLSPSKTVNQNISPNSNISPNAKSPKKRQLQFKENHNASSEGSSQTKRKSNSCESTPKFQKTSKNKKRTSQSASKQHSPESAITNYFKQSPNEK